MISFPSFETSSHFVGELRSLCEIMWIYGASLPMLLDLSVSALGQFSCYHSHFHAIFSNISWKKVLMLPGRPVSLLSSLHVFVNQPAEACAKRQLEQESGWEKPMPWLPPFVVQARSNMSEGLYPQGEPKFSYEIR